MSRAKGLKAILRISAMRCEAQARRCAMADAVASEAATALEQARQAHRDVEARIASLATAARQAFLSSPQTAHAVERMLGESRANSDKVEAARAAVEAAAVVLAEAQAAAQAEWDRRRDLERTAQKRGRAVADLARQEFRQAEIRIEDTQNDERSQRVAT